MPTTKPAPITGTCSNHSLPYVNRRRQCAECVAMTERLVAVGPPPGWPTVRRVGRKGKRVAS